MDTDGMNAAARQTSALGGAGRAALAATAGAALMYFLDPDRGRRRRAITRDRVAATARRAARSTARLQRRATAEASGLARRVAHRQPEDAPSLDDATLAQKVESTLFRDPEIPKGRVNVGVEEGVVVLRGQLDRAEQITALEAATRDIPGVREVKSLLHLPHTPAPNKQRAIEAS